MASARNPARTARTPPARPPPLVDLVPIKPRVLSRRTIANVDPQLLAAIGIPEAAREALGARSSDGPLSLGLLTCTSDDALYVALDEGTKAAPVEVIYARSFYAGAGHASGPLSGEVIGVYAGRDPDEVAAALARCAQCLEEEAWFYAANASGSLAFFPHVVRAVGRYLSAQAGIPVGSAMAYLIAPPLESVIGLDAALKAAPVTLKKWFGPPSETNFGGGYLAGEIDDCEAAARAFASAVIDVAKSPLDEARQARAAGEEPSARPPSIAGSGRYKVLATGERLAHKPEHLTHLVDDESLIDKSHPRLPLRGKLDLLQGRLLEAQVRADADSAPALVGELQEAVELARKLVGCEVMDRPVGDWSLGGLAPDAIRHASHHTWELYGVPFMFPAAQQGPVVAALTIARATCREAELCCYRAFPGEDERGDLKLALNRLSSAIYLMQVKYVGGKYPGGRRRLGPIKGWKPPAK